MAPTSGKTNVLDTDISFDMERLFDHYNFDHIPTEKRLQYFKQRDLSHVKYYKAAVKIFGGPSSRTRAIVAPPMETPFKHRLGIYENICKPPTPLVLNGILRPPPELVKLQTNEEIAEKEEEKHIANYNSLIAKRKQLRKDLDSLTPNEAYLARKKDKSELEKRVQAKYKSDRLRKPEDTPSPEAAPSPRPPPNVPTMTVPPPDGLQILDKFLSLNNMRLMDLFLTADKDKSWLLSRQEFLNAITQAEIPLTESEVDDLIVTLDADLDEKLTYQELNKGLQLWRKHRRFIKKQSEGTDKKYLEITSKGHHMKLALKQKEGDLKTTEKNQSERSRDYQPKPSKKVLESNLKLESKEYCKGDLSNPKQNGITGPFCEDNTEEAITLESSAESSPLLTNNVKRSDSAPNYSGKITGNDKKLKQLMKLDNLKMPDLELSKKYTGEDEFRISKFPLQNYANFKTCMLKGEDNFPASDNSLSNVLMFDEKAFPILNTNESLSHDSRYHDLVSMSEEVAQSTDQNSEDLIKSLERRDRFSKETRPPSHNSSTHSRTSTPNSLEPPEPYLGKKAWLPASAEELVEIRKHDRIVLSRNKIRRSLTLEKRKAFDKLPGVIKIGYKPIDDHCSESTLGGDNADMVNQFRRQKLKEYYDVKKLFEERGLNFTQKTLDKVLLYPGDKPTSKLRKGIIMPVGPLTDELSSFIKWKQRSKKSQNWQKDNKQHYRSSDIGNGDEKVKTWTYGGDESDKGKSFLPRRAHRSKQRSRRMTNRDYLTAEDVYPFASTVTPKVYSKNLSSGRALISRKVDSWMTFEDYSKYTQNLPNRFHHVNKRSNPNAVWPGYLLNKLRLYMDSDLTLVDGHGRPLENRDSSAYEGYGTGMYNGRGNALFRHTAQPKRAYTGYNNDLLTWPVGKNGVRYGNIDEHRLVK